MIRRMWGTNCTAQNLHKTTLHIVSKRTLHASGGRHSFFLSQHLNQLLYCHQAGQVGNSHMFRKGGLSPATG